MGFNPGLVASLSRSDFVRWMRPKGFGLLPFFDDWGEAASYSPADETEISLRRGSAEVGLWRECSEYEGSDVKGEKVSVQRTGTDGESRVAQAQVCESHLGSTLKVWTIFTYLHVSAGYARRCL